jgi:alpha-L-rhamnosidase
MFRQTILLGLAFASILASGGILLADGEQPRAVDLRCESLRDPLGIDSVRPRLSWRIEPGNPYSRNVRQSAYRILVAGSAADLQADRGDLWDSGRVESDRTTFVEYEGKPLASRTECYWKVMVWNQDGQASPWSEPGKWSMGLLAPTDWKASWIGLSPKPDRPKNDPWFRKTFSLEAKPQRATAYVASLGYHELYVNGQKVDDRVLAPSICDLSRRARYVTHDIAKFLHEGTNAVALWCAPGWADFAEFKVADKPLITSQIEIQLADGSSVEVLTDATWKTHPSPLSPIGNWHFQDFGGESFDASTDMPKWNSAELDDSAWQPAAVFSPKVELSAEMVEPNRRLETLEPASIESKGPNVFRVDMGKNFTGWFEIRLKGKPGQLVTLQFAERPEQTETYAQRSECILDKSGKGVFCHRFNYAAFRWATIEGIEQSPRKEDVRGYLVSTDLARTGRFECSDAYLNRLYETTMWTFRSLSLGGYTVDCPHRERLGYGGDGHATMETAMMNFGCDAFYAKWLGDWRDVQRPDGDLPYTAPTCGGGGGPAWGGICITLPWQTYLHYGDRRVLVENYPMMRRWIAFLQSKSKNHLLEKWGGIWDFLGDWVPPGKGQNPGERVDERSTLFFNNCYYRDNVATIAKIAELLGKTDEAAAYRQEADEIARAAQREFFNPQDDSYVNGDQLYEAMPLLMGVTPEQLQPAVMKRLEREILINKKGYIDTGIHGTAFLLKLLTERDRNDLIYAMADKRDYPGWGYMFEHGATTLWEQWDGQNSLLHSSFISIGAWFHEGIAGIQLDPAQPGYKHFTIRPGLGGDLTWAKAEYDTPHGTIRSEWRISAGKLSLNVEVPPNTTATIFVPTSDASSITESGKPIETSAKAPTNTESEGFAIFEVGSGRYRFSSAWEKKSTNP